MVEGEEHESLRLNPELYISKLEESRQVNPDDMEILGALAEAYFEVGELDKALPVLTHAVELDPKGQHGSQKFLWLGQIYGGRKGLGYFVQGIELLHDDMRKAESQTERDAIGLQISQAYLGMIEIWMTDLCMAPEAEKQCEKLIAGSFLASDANPEAWSVLGSIRISQLRPQEATDALRRSWSVYSSALEQEALDVSVIPQLIRLAQSLFELRQLDLVLEITAEIFRLDDQVSDLYYLNALTHQVLGDEATGEEVRDRHRAAVHEAARLMLEVTDPDEEILAAVEDIAKKVPQPDYNPYEKEDRAMIIDESFLQE